MESLIEKQKGQKYVEEHEDAEDNESLEESQMGHLKQHGKGQTQAMGARYA